MAEVPPTLESVDQKLTALLEAQARTGLHHLSHCPRPVASPGTVRRSRPYGCRWQRGAATNAYGGVVGWCTDASVAALTRAQERSDQQLGEVMTLLHSIAQDVAALRGTTRVVVDAKLGAPDRSPASIGSPPRQATVEDAQEIGASLGSSLQVQSRLIGLRGLCRSFARGVTQPLPAQADSSARTRAGK